MVERALAADIPLWVRSIYGAETHEPYVELQLGATTAQFPVPQAQMIAAWIGEAAEAATQDAFLIEWMMSTLDLTPLQAAQILGEFRQWRSQRFAG
jgi:hypothetical protein